MQRQLSARALMPPPGPSKRLNTVDVKPRFEGSSSKKPFTRRPEDFAMPNSTSGSSFRNSGYSNLHTGNRSNPSSNFRNRAVANPRSDNSNNFNTSSGIHSNSGIHSQATQFRRNTNSLTSNSSNLSSNSDARKPRRKRRPKKKKDQVVYMWAVVFIFWQIYGSLASAIQIVIWHNVPNPKIWCCSKISHFNFLCTNTWSIACSNTNQTVIFTVSYWNILFNFDFFLRN